MAETEIAATLRVDRERGVIYVDSAKTGFTILRICRLPAPIPDVYAISDGNGQGLDVTHLVGASWGPTADRSKDPVYDTARVPEQARGMVLRHDFQAALRECRANLDMFPNPYEAGRRFWMAMNVEVERWGREHGHEIPERK